MDGDGHGVLTFGRRQLFKAGIGITAGALGGLPGARPGGGRTVEGASALVDDADAPGAPAALTVDGLGAPLGLSAFDVHFAWHVTDPRRGARQGAYQLMVSEAAGAGGTVWDSGRVASPRQAFVAYGGPALAPDTAYRWTVRTWPAAGPPGPWAAPATFDTGLQDGDWRASWLRPPSDAGRPDVYAYVRRTFAVGSSPVVRARAHVSADQQFVLSANGTRVGRGQAFCYPDSQYYATFDLTDALVAGGPNAVGLVCSWIGATKGRPAGTPGLIAQISVLHADGSRELLVTDGSWRAHRGAWLPGTQRDLEGDEVGYTENIDGRLVPPGWDTPGFDDSGWAPAQVIGPAGTSPWTHLVAVRTRIVETPVAPVSVTTLASGALVADFGRVYAASPVVRFHAGRPGRVVTMRGGYLLDEPAPGRPVDGEAGQVSARHGTQHTDMGYSYVQAGGTEAFEAFDYLGLRYLQVDDPGEPLGATDVVAMARHAAVPDEHAATFSSSDPTVDAIFELACHSALYTAQEQFVDTPTREKGPWLWDGFSESCTAMAAFGEQNLTRKSLLEFAQSQRRYWPNGAINKIYPTGLGAGDIDEDTEIYAEWVWQYWLHTGDEALLEALYPTLVRLAGYVWRAVDSATGLVRRLPSVDRAGLDLPVTTRVNILGANVLGRAGDVASVLGRSRDAEHHRGRRRALVDAIDASLVRSDGLYVDGLRADGSRAGVSQDANACALAHGVVPAGRQAAVARYVAGKGMAVPPRTAAEVLRALAVTGRAAEMVRILTDARIDGWAQILARGGTFTWEVWQPSDSRGDSMSHGWGSSVLVEIVRHLLGVQPTAGGFATVAVVPPTTALSHAQGVVPTPRGPIEVAWRRGGGTFALDLTVPANARATVRLPVGRTGTLTESGTAPTRSAAVEVASVTGDRTVLHVGAGTYRFLHAGGHR